MNLKQYGLVLTGLASGAVSFFLGDGLESKAIQNYNALVHGTGKEQRLVYNPLESRLGGVAYAQEKAEASVPSGDDLINQLEAKIKANPQDAVSYNHLGFLYESKGQLDKAKEAYYKVAELRPANSTQDNIRYVDDLFENVAVPADYLYPGAKTIEGKFWKRSRSTTNSSYQKEEWEKSYATSNADSGNIRKTILEDTKINVTLLETLLSSKMDSLQSVIFFDEGKLLITFNSDLHQSGRYSVFITTGEGLGTKIRNLQ
jgi:tetratricopeptide (TPR) repeat protein